MIAAVMLLTISAYLTYRFLRFAHRFGLIHDDLPRGTIRAMSYLMFLFQVLTCVGLSWMALDLFDLFRRQP